MQIDYSYFILYKRLSNKFKTETIERHFEKAKLALLNRQDAHLKKINKEVSR